MLNKDRLSIGRDVSSDVRIDDQYASDHHADFVHRGSSWAIIDVGSLNGTYVNGSRIHETTSLHAGDRIRIGQTELVLRMPTADPGAYPAPPPPIRYDVDSGDDITLERLPARRPEGQIVAESAVLEDEEVSRGGLVVERTWQYARWTGGQPVLWLGRRVKAGRGEGSSGLAWDFTEPPPTT